MNNQQHSLCFYANITQTMIIKQVFKCLQNIRTASTQHTFSPHVCEVRCPQDLAKKKLQPVLFADFYIYRQFILIKVPAFFWQNKFFFWLIHKNVTLQRRVEGEDAIFKCKLDRHYFSHSQKKTSNTKCMYVYCIYVL